MQHLNLRNPHGIKNKKRNHFQRRQLNELHFFPKHPRINNQDQDPPSRSSKFQTRNPEPRDRSDSRKLPSCGSERGDTHPPIYPPHGITRNPFSPRSTSLYSDGSGKRKRKGIEIYWNRSEAMNAASAGSRTPPLLYSCRQ